VITLGLALTAYAAWGLMGRSLHAPSACERWLGPLTGAITGALTAVTGVFVLPAVVYLQALELSRDELVQAMGLSFTVSTVALAVALAGQSAFSTPLAGASMAMLVPAMLGMAAGQWVRSRLSVPVFRRCFFSGLAALGVYMIVRELQP